MDGRHRREDLPTDAPVSPPALADRGRARVAARVPRRRDGSALMLSRPLMRKLFDDLLSNYSYVGLMALVTLFVLPQYARMLGPEQWGTVALCITIQAFLFSVDQLLGPTMLREVARAAEHGRQHAAYLRFLRLYALPAFAGFVLGIAILWMLERQRAAQGGAMPADLVWALRLALVQALFQFSNNAAIGYWSGLNQQRRANRRLAAFVLLKHGLALTLLVTWGANAVVYMLPFALVSALEFLANHRRIERDGDAAPAVVGTGHAATEWRDLAGFGAAATLGLITAQIDRAFLSFALPVEQYGVYVLVGSLMLSMLSLQAPIQRAFLPRLTTATDPQLIAKAMLKVECALLVLPALLMAAFPETVLLLWLHDAELVRAGAPTFRLLMLGVALNAVYVPASAMLLHLHRNAAIAAINLTVLGVQLWILAVWTPQVGMVAGAWSWLACGLVQLVCAVFIAFPVRTPTPRNLY
jgi:O-antigen/teichoic acid export membrane protein